MLSPWRNLRLDMGRKASSGLMFNSSVIMRDPVKPPSPAVMWVFGNHKTCHLCHCILTGSRFKEIYKDFNLLLTCLPTYVPHNYLWRLLNLIIIQP